jgi:hypothetical protein
MARCAMQRSAGAGGGALAVQPRIAAACHDAMREATAQVDLLQTVGTGLDHESGARIGHTQVARRFRCSRLIGAATQGGEGSKANET